ncbi:MAG: hypothetical protein RLZZ127_1585 [Planctomycetota bacterium]|jgi:hypothetical protein
MRTALATLVLTLAPMAAHAADLAALNQAYQQAGRQIIDQVNARTVDQAAVSARVLDMLRQAVPAARDYATRHPEGTRLIEAVIAQAAVLDDKGAVTAIGPMKDLPFTEIETQWHDLGHFAKVDVGIDLAAEANEHFTDPLHAMIHPVMVLRAATDYAQAKDQASLDRMKAEMDEGMEQMEKLAQAGK